MIEIEMNISATLTEQNSEKTSIEHVGYGHKITLFFSMCQYPCEINHSILTVSKYGKKLRKIENKHNKGTRIEITICFRY